ncbi:HIT family protein [Streptomyces sp. NBC_01077]|uniref:HIT family protein n=1 Tax=Streptomyces sp. NBC_01077 TaxID=2903746 RepID=UPI00386C0009|nr:HIT family protein [Streptomyces sp. NBC_01077]
MEHRRAMDLEAYEERARRGPCFVCAFLDGHPDYEHHLVYEDADHIAFLDRWPTVPGKVLVAPRRHVECVVSGFTEDEYTRIMLIVRKVALAVEKVFAPERIYLLSLGAQNGNSHVHWHVAGLPPGVPYEQQQFHALMSENGVLDVTPERAAAVAAQLRAALT